ncbi:hypothetical protein IAU60_003401 [Kwoniella sp. DSM 27419]
MNTLSRLDSYLSSLLTSAPPPPPPPIPARPLHPQVRRLTTPPIGSPRLSNLPPTPRRRSRRSHRRQPQTYSSVKVPPPTTPLVVRIALVLWSILLSFWRSLVGETRSGRSRKRKGGVGFQHGRNRLSSATGGVGVLRELGESLMASAGIVATEKGADEGEDPEAEGEADATDAEATQPEDEASGWVDPVTRAPEGQDSLDEPPPTEDEFAVATIEDQPVLRQDPKQFTFRLKSAKPTSSDSTSSSLNGDDLGVGASQANGPAVIAPPFIHRKSMTSFQPTPAPQSILSNPLRAKALVDKAHLRLEQLPTPLDEKSILASAESTETGRRSPKILANPISTSILDPSVPAPRTNAASSLFRKPSPSLRVPRPHQTPFHLQKTLILDLDETLIHSTSRPLKPASSGGGGILGLSLGGLVGKGKSREGHAVEVVLNGRSTMYHVYKRPYVDHFLKKVASWYTLVIFTASMPEYADPVIDWLDAGRNLFARKLYRDSCHLQPNGSYVKDLALVEADLSRVCFMDNSPVSYNWNKANALPIEGWTSDPNDEALLHSIPVLDSLRFVNDVRRVLGIRGFT